MAATELSQRRGARGRWLPAGLGAAWVRAYAAVWLGALAAAGLVTLVGRPLIMPARGLLGATLSAQANPPPQLGHVLALAAHNIPIFSWPLLLGVLDAHHRRLARHVADGVVVAAIFVNTAQVGIGLGAYGRALLPYLPHVPLEWAAAALGASGWLAQRRGMLTIRTGLAVFALIVAVLLCAAFLEVVAVPHR
jgi:hypothetical protein